MNQLNSKAISKLLSSYPLVGIASRDRFETDLKSLSNKHPDNLLKGFQSVIVFGDGQHKHASDKVTESFDDRMTQLSQPLELVAYLNKLGYKSHIAHKSELDVSLVDMAVKAGIGELSPVNSLVVKNYGLTPVIQAIITEAPLEASDLAQEKSHCIQCNLCLKVCPIRDQAFADGDIDRKSVV